MAVSNEILAMKNTIRIITIEPNLTPIYTPKITIKLIVPLGHIGIIRLNFSRQFSQALH